MDRRLKHPQVSSTSDIDFQKMRNSEPHHINSDLNAKFSFDIFALHFFSNPDTIVKVVKI